MPFHILLSPEETKALARKPGTLDKYRRWDNSYEVGQTNPPHGLTSSPSQGSVIPLHARGLLEATLLRVKRAQRMLQDPSTGRIAVRRCIADCEGLWQSIHDAQQTLARLTGFVAIENPYPSFSSRMLLRWAGVMHSCGGPRIYQSTYDIDEMAEHRLIDGVIVSENGWAGHEWRLEQAAYWGLGAIVISKD